MEAKRTIQDEWYERLEAKAERMGCSMRALFLRAGVHEMTLSRWRQGHNTPTARTIQKLLDVPEDGTQAEQAE